MMRKNFQSADELEQINFKFNDLVNEIDEHMEKFASTFSTKNI